MKYMIFFSLWIMLSCKSQELYISKKTITIENDSTTIWVTKEDNRTDTVRYKKRTYYEQTSPKTLRGKWYVVTAVVIGVITFLLIKK